MTATATGLWTAPFASGPVHARVTVPGSKSITNRALLLAALAAGPSRLEGPLVARDTQLMVEAIRSLGVTVSEATDSWVIEPGSLCGPARIDCGLAGTVMRFVPPVAALANGTIWFDGDSRARERPMAAIFDALRSLGVRIEGAVDRLPFTLHGTGAVDGGIVTIDASSSSQFVSALLLAGARYVRGVDIRHDGKPIPSLPHIAMTIGMLRQRGVVVDDSEPNRWVVEAGPVAALDLVVEPDLSNAAPFLAAGLVTGGSVTVTGWPAHTTQAGDSLREIFTRLGAEVARDASSLTVTGSGTITGVDLDLHDVGELAPVIAAVCAVADSPSYLRGIAHLRGHETDRLAALSTELRHLGCDAREIEDGLEIHPQPLTAGVFSTYDDHRMAHAAAVLGLAVDGIRVENVATTTKTHPDFVGAWMAMLA